MAKACDHEQPHIPCDHCRHGFTCVACGGCDETGCGGWLWA